MKIFISYAHVDEAQVRELVEILRDAHHDPWFDHRLKAGRVWEDQLLQAIQGCDCFLYALTPESTASEWCQWEFSQAVHAGKPILPVLMQANVTFNGALTVLNRIQYVDLSQGITIRSTAGFLGCLVGAEPIPPEQVPLLSSPSLDTAPERPAEKKSGSRVLAEQLYEDAYAFYKNEQYSRARTLLADCLRIAADYSDAQTLMILVEAKIEKPVSLAPESVKPQETKRQSPKLAKPQLLHVEELLPQPFEWIEIPTGKVKLVPDDTDKEESYLKQETLFDVPAFVIAKYPITNAQYVRFIEAGGYNEKKWWTEAGWSQRQQDGWIEPRWWQDSEFNGADQPVVGVSWYEAAAFCQWLSEAAGEKIVLPTEQQWQRAAQGDDGRNYPWGNEKPTDQLCNFGGNVVRTTPVTQYPNGASSYGVMDMSGNVWEWCVTSYELGSILPDRTDVRVMRGGSWYNDYSDYFRVSLRNWNYPYSRYYDIGFRVVCSAF